MQISARGHQNPAGAPFLALRTDCPRNGRDGVRVSSARNRTGEIVDFARGNVFLFPGAPESNDERLASGPGPRVSRRSRREYTCQGASKCVHGSPPLALRVTTSAAARSFRPGFSPAHHFLRSIGGPESKVLTALLTSRAGKHYVKDGGTCRSPADHTLPAWM